MKVSDLIVEVFYHIGGLSLTVVTLYILYMGITAGLTPSVLGLIVMSLSGFYVGSVVKDLYRVFVCGEDYEFGLS